jgi:hypothetical protein
MAQVAPSRGRWKPLIEQWVFNALALAVFFQRSSDEDYLMLANNSFMHSFRKHTDVLADGEEHPRHTPHHKEHVADHRQDTQLYTFAI